MADTQIQALLGQMQKTLECSICLEMMTRPVSTSCGHQFCRFCLMEFLHRKKQVPCPLCKKTITKRSLTEREQLGEMVEGVRNMITAFQKDTGALFSPPRGPQTSILPGTPESIQGKPASKESSSRRRSNIRQSKRGQSSDTHEDTDPVIETTTSERVSNTSFNHEEGQPLPDKKKIKSGPKFRKAKNKKISVVSDDKSDNIDDNNRQNELLKYIAEGRHGTNTPAHMDIESTATDDTNVTTVEENSASTSGIESKFSSTPVTSSNENCELPRTSNKKTTNSIENCELSRTSNKKTTNSNENCELSRTSNKNTTSSIENGELPKTFNKKSKTLLVSESVDVVNDVIDIDADHDVDISDRVEVDLNDVEDVDTGADEVIDLDCSPDDVCTNLSGSITVDSQSSSGPLFKTPVDLKVGSKKALVKDPVVKKTRTLRSRKETVVNKEEDDELGSASDIIMTPEISVAKENKIGKTYSKKDKEVHLKEKKSTKKVADWLKNIGEPAAPENNIETKANFKNEKKVKTSLKKSLKLLKEEEEMGKKMKHLAQQIQDKEKSLLFEFEDFDCNEVSKGNGEGDKGSADAAIVIAEDVNETSDTEEGKVMETVDKSVTMEINESRTATVSIPETDTDIQVSNVSINEGVCVSKVDEGLSSGDEIPKILNKRRIFKSRVQKSSGDDTNRENVPKNESVLEKSVQGQFSDVNDIVEKKGDTCSTKESTDNLSCSDPYEFKSSQPTPKKTVVNKAKGKGKKNKKAGNTVQKKTKTGVKRAAVVEVLEGANDEVKVEKIWNKNMKPDKTILKNKNDLKEINAVSIQLQQAESYDLLTSTQEAANCIDEEQKKLQAKTVDQSLEPNASRKRVRFAEPTISDFVSSSHIDMIGYRKAKEDFTNKTKDAPDSKTSTETDVVKVAPRKLVGQTTKSEASVEDPDVKSDMMLDDDSSGTDDLDIEPTQDQFEQPNIEIQSDEIKVQLSQQFDKKRTLENINVKPSSVPKSSSKNLPRKSGNVKLKKGKSYLDDESITCVAETPQIPVLRDSPLVNTVEETPMLPSIPKFNKNLSKPLKKLRSTRFSEKSPHPSSKNTHELDEGQGELCEKIFESSNFEMHEKNNMDSMNLEDQVGEHLVTKGSNSELFQDELPFLDAKHEDKLDVSASLDSTQPPDIEPGIIAESCEDMDTRDETLADLDNDCCDSLSQQSDLILQTKKSVKTLNKSHVSEKSNNSNHITSNSDDVICVEDETINATSNKRTETNTSKIDESLSTGSSGSNRKLKKKRKSFMLEDNEESLDFGSLTVRDVNTQDNDCNGKIVKETKRKRKRSGHSNTGENTKSPKTPKSPKTLVKLNIGPEQSDHVCETEKDSVEICYSKDIESVGIIADSISYSSVESELSKTKSENARSFNDQMKPKPCVNKSVNENNYSTKSPYKGRDAQVNEATDDVYVIEETERNSMDASYTDIEIPSSRKIPRRKKKSGKKYSCEKALNSSGLLVSPEETVQLSGQDRDTLADTAMPSLDLSPLEEETLGSPTKSSDSHLYATKGSNEPSDSPIGEKDTKVKSSLKNSPRELSIDRKAESDTPSKRLSKDPDYSPENKKRRSGIKAVRGFARKKQAHIQSPAVSNHSLSPVSGCEKYKSSKKRREFDPTISASPVHKTDAKPCDGVSDTDLNTSAVGVKSMGTPDKHITVTNISKYSPLVYKLKSKNNESPHTKSKKVKPEIIELKIDLTSKEMIQDSCALSPNELPDLDDNHVSLNETDDISHKNDENSDEETKVVEEHSLSDSKHPKKHSVNMECDYSEQGFLDDRNTIPETLSPTADVINKLSQQSNRAELDDKQDNEIDTNVLKEDVDLDCASVSSSSSSDFNLDSSEDESPAKEAMSVISNYNKIVSKSLEVDNPSKTASKSDLGVRNKKSVKCQEKHLDENARVEVNFNVVGMYSSKLDSSSEDSVAGDDNDLVAMESDGEGDNDLVVLDTDSSMEGKAKRTVDKARCIDSDDDSDDALDHVIRKKGAKRPISSDSSSDDEDENSQRMNLTSSSAFSSQSENMTTQERQSLEKDLERMAAEMKAMKEQLRKSKEQALVASIDRADKVTMDTSHDIDDSLESIEDILSDDGGDDDLFLSQPAYDSHNDDVVDVCMDVEAKVEDDSIHTVPESQPNSIAYQPVFPIVVYQSFPDPEDENQSTSEDENQSAPIDGNQSVPEVENQSIPMNGNQSVPGDENQSVQETENESTPEDANQSIPESENQSIPKEIDIQDVVIKRDIGIVVTGLNVSQVQDTKRLAVKNGCKFFSKFNDSVTHVVVNPAEDDDTMCDRTLKFFQGIANKCWIVNYFWIVDSKQAGHLLPEGPYEIQGDTANNTAHYGPKRSRLAKDNQLFSRFDLALVGNNDFLSKDSMTDLIKTCGGHVVDLSNLSQGQRQSLVISCADLENEDEQSCAVKQAKGFYKKRGLVMLTREWVLDSLTLFRIQPLQDYVITDIPNKNLPKI